MPPYICTNARNERGIEIPYPHMTLYAGADKNGQAPALPLRLARERVRQPVQEGRSGPAARSLRSIGHEAT